jgi:2'-5' RNA ligase
MIFPEFENVHVINNIREKYDPLVDLVLPHITLVFPFDSELTNKEISLYLKERLRDIHPFKVELEGFSKQEEKTEKYLFLNVAEGRDVIKNIHDILYKDKLKQFNMGNNYVPHMTVGKVSSLELLNKAFDDVNKHYNEKFSTVVKKYQLK